MSEIDKYYKNWVDETLSKVKLDEDKKEKLLSSHTKEKEKVTSEFRKLTGLDKKIWDFICSYCFAMYKTIYIRWNNRKSNR